MVFWSRNDLLWKRKKTVFSIIFQKNRFFLEKNGFVRKKPFFKKTKMLLQKKTFFLPREPHFLVATQAAHTHNELPAAHERL